MARKSRAPAKIQKAVRELTFNLDSATNYVDLGQSLSVVNRKLFRQGMVYGVESVDFMFDSNPTLYDVVQITALTAGDSWSVHNAHVKGHALWNQMNELVLEDNPSVQGKWADYKVYLDGAHFAATNLRPRDGGGVQYQEGEWNYSTYVIPQHDVDPAAGVPLDAPAVRVHLIGDNTGVPIPTPPGTSPTVSLGLIKAYEESRATVFDDNPNVPGGMSTSFFSVLTDTGSQEPELADVIEASNDDPPYNLTNYPGGDTNAVNPIITEFAAASVGNPNGMLTSFLAQCGLIKFKVEAFKNGAAVSPVPTVIARINLMPGKYKGIAAVPMGQ